MISYSRNRSLGFAIWLGLTASATTVLGNVIPVNNPSFETLPVGGLPLTSGCLNPGCSWSTTAIPGWTKTGSTGQFRPGLSAHFNVLPDGPTSAWSNNGTISQTVAATVQLGRPYTLLVDLGNRKDYPFRGVASLLINGNTYLASGSAPGDGFWSTYTASYVGLPADVGKPITIQLSANAAQGNFDNVRLSMPEPADIVILLGTAIGLLISVTRPKT